VRAVAYKDISRSSETNNLYVAWYLTQNSRHKQAHVSTVAWKSQFLEFIEKYCSDKMKEYEIKNNKFFDEAMYHETMLLIEKYYKIDDKLKLLQGVKL